MSTPVPTTDPAATTPTPAAPDRRRPSAATAPRCGARPRRCGGAGGPAPSCAAAPALTVVLAFIGTGGRLAVPILVQQAIDKGFVNGQVDMGKILQLAIIGVVFITIASIAMWGAIVRLAVRAEDSLYGLRMRVFDHMLSPWTWPTTRRSGGGASSLASRRTSRRSASSSPGAASPGCSTGR